MSVEQGGREALDELFWRAEILQALYWMRGEGLADAVEPAMLAGFLVAEPALIAGYLGRLAGEGYLEPLAAADDAPPARYRLTPRGVSEGGRSFHDEFADLIHQGHGECAPGCACHHPEHAGQPCPSHAA